VVGGAGERALEAARVSCESGEITQSEFDAIKQKALA